MKKVLASFLVFVMLLTVLPLGAIPVSAAKSGVTGDCTWELDDNGHLIISGNGAMKDSYQPWGTAITSVTIEDGVTAIGKGAFSNCDSLTSAVVGDSVTVLGQSAFSDCDRLSSVVLGNSVTTIENLAFYFCDKMTSLNIPSSVATIGDSAFWACNALPSIYLPENVSSIGKDAFRSVDGPIEVAENNLWYCSLDGVLFTKDMSTLLYCYEDKDGDYAIPEGVVTIEPYAFSGCWLTSVIIPDSVTTMGEYAFLECRRLSLVVIGNGITSIESYTFEYCDRLTDVTIGNSVTTIKDSAFRKCERLSSIVIPDNVKTIEMEAFADCTGLTSVIIGNGVTTVGKAAFSGCAKLASVDMGYSVITIGDDAFYNCKKLSSVTIPDSVTSIGENAFYECYNLTSAIIGNNVTDIGTNAFYGCTRLSELAIGNSVTYIGDSAFNNCDSLTSVTIPDSVVDVGNWAFSNCDQLRNVVLSEYITEIKQSVFSRCTSLEEISIPDSVTIIGQSAFWGCTSLLEVIIGTGVSSIEGAAFYGCTGLVSMTIPAAVDSISGSAFDNCSNLTEFLVAADNVHYSDVQGVIFSKDKTTLVKYPTGRQGGYSIPNGVTAVGDYAFSSCTGLTAIDFPNSVTTIGVRAFDGCTTLSSVNIPDDITEVGEWAFRVCSSLLSVTMGNGITSVNEGTFSGCSNLQTVTIGKGVTRICEDAFYNCKQLTVISIPDSLRKIDIRAFYGCGLSTIYFSGTEEQWNNINIGTRNEPLHKATRYYCMEIPFAISASDHMVRVVNSSGTPIPNARIEVIRKSYTETHYTEEGGFAKFNKFSLGNIDFTITAEGYESYTTVGKNFELDESGLDVIILYTPEEAGLMLVKATYQNTDSSYNEVLGEDVNLIKGTKRLSLFNKGRGYFRVLCSNSDASLVEKYVLYQNGNVIATSQDGTFNLRIVWFEAGKGIYVTTFGKDGTSVSTPLNLEICDDETAKSVEVSFGDKITVTVPESFPFVGGSKIEYDIPILPLEFVVEDGKVYAGLNIKWKENDDGDLEHQTYKQQYEKIKTVIDDVKKLSKYKVGSHLKSNIDQFLKKRDKFNLPVAGKAEVTIFGGGEMTWSDAGLDGMKLQAYLLVDWYAEKTWQTYYVVPITVNIKVGVEGKVSATIDWNFDTDTVNGDVEVNIKPHLNAFGGAGVGKWVGVGAYGEAEVDIGLQLFGTTTSPGPNYVDLTGELGLKVYVGPLTYSKPFTHNTWHLYTRTDALRRATNPRLYYADVFDSSNYAIDDISYLEDQSVWLGNRSVNKRLLARPEKGAISIQPLLMNTYRNLQPTIAATADDAVMVYIGADAGREAQNVAAMMYSIYNPLTETWSEPVQVDSNLTADNAPMVHSDGETIRLVYQDSVVVYDDDFSQEEYLTTQNIVVYVYDSATNTFAHEQTFAADSAQYRAPQLTEVNGAPALVWIEGEGTDLFGQGDNNKFMCSYYRNGAWTAPSVFADDLCSIADYTVGAIGGELNILYVADADNDLGTDTDRSLILLNANESTIVGEGAASQLSFVKLPSEREETFAWVADEMLCALNANGKAQAVCSIGSPESVTVVGNKILFTAAGEGDSEIYAVVYDEAAATYGVPVQISEQEKYVERLSGVDFNGAELLVMTRKAVTIGENSVADDCEFAWAVLNDQADLKIGSVEYDYADIKDGEIPLYLSVSNQGAASADSYTVSVKDAGSNVVVEQTFEATFLAGETKDIVLMMPLDNVTEIANYTVSIGVSSESTSDSQTMTIGYADLAVSTESIKVGSQNTLVCTVTNKGLSAGSGELLVYDGTEDNMVSFAVIDSLTPGETKTFVIDLTGETPERILTCMVKSNAEDYAEANNSEKIYFDFSVFVESECQHIYDNSCDTDCNACGAAREVSVPDIITFDGSSVSEDVNGLAFRFTIDVTGMTQNVTTAVYDNAKVMYNGQEYSLVGMGAIVSNDADAELIRESADGVRTTDIFAKYLWNLNEDSASYAVRVIDIPENGKDTTVYARAYFLIEVEGEQVVVYADDVAEQSYNGVLNG